MIARSFLMGQAISPDNLRVVVPIVAGVGNALMAVPTVQQLKTHLPAARVTVVAMSDSMGEPFRRLSEVDQVFVSGKGRRGIARGIRFTREQHPDVYLVPFPSNRWQYNLLAAASGAKRVIMHSYPVGRWRTLTFLSVADRLAAQRGIHDVVQNLRLLTLLGIEPDESEQPRFILNDGDRTRAAELLRSAGLNDGARFIAIHIHAVSAKTVLAQAKRWSTQKYATLISALS
jgi:ADP-heptose:LPS heptosyltransferase